jgi:phosphate transport system substrate-binding protein
MNDEFLHALRRDPPPEFARELKRRLRQQAAPRGLRFPVVLVMLVIGGVAMAAALLLRNRDEPLPVAAPVAQQAAPKSSARATQPTTVARSDRQLPSVTPAPPAAEEDDKDIPVALVTSSLARPLAEALAETVSKYNARVARTRVMTMEDDESFKALCGNADFAMTSRRIADAERAQCQKWGIDVVEWKLGYQAVALAAAPTTELSPLAPREVFLALARRIPDPAEPSRLIENPNMTWRDVDARFDNRSIDVLMPPDATTRAVFLQLVMEPGCEATHASIRRLKALDRPLYDDICHGLRSDGRLREVALTNTLVTQQLWAQPNWLIVLDYSYYARYRRELSTMLEGPAPTSATLTDGTYPAARPVYVYGQSGRLYWPAGTRGFAYELTSPYTVGPQGSLARRGLVPLDDLERSEQRKERSK